MMDEVKLCRLKALIRSTWPGEYEVKRDLKLVADEPQPPQPAGAGAEHTDTVMQCLIRARIREIKGFKARAKLTLIQGGLEP